MDLDQYPEVVMPDGSRHRIVPEDVLRVIFASRQSSSTDHFGQRIKALRVLKGLSQGDLAIRCGLNQSKVSRVESEASEPDAEIKSALTKALDL